MAHDATLLLKLSSVDKAAWQRKADAIGLSLSEWIRMRCNRDDGPLDAVARPLPSAPAPGRISLSHGRGHGVQAVVADARPVYAPGSLLKKPKR